MLRIWGSGGGIGQCSVAWDRVARAGGPQRRVAAWPDSVRLFERIEELLSEFALAHVEGSKTVAAYARDDLLEARRPVMQAWSDYVVRRENRRAGSND